MKYLVVDGHSVIFGWPELRRLHSRRNSLAREELIKQLTEYQDATGVHVAVVFDGQGVKTAEESTPGGIQVFYSGSRGTADSVIERLAAGYAKEHEMTVVTSDLLERQTVSAFGAYTVSAEGFREQIEQARADLGRELKKLRRR
jgi:hypothetical protein